MSEIRTHRITWAEDSPREDEVQQALEDINEGDENVIRERIGGLWVDWPHHQLHMAKLSLRWPEVIFTLEYQGEDIGDRARERYRNGACHRDEAAWRDEEFNPKRAEPAGIGRLTFAMMDRTPVPDHPGFQCSGADSGFHDLESVHFGDDMGAIKEPGELWYAELVDEEYAMEGSGFLCEDCLKAVGLTSDGRPSLVEEMARRRKERVAA